MIHSFTDIRILLYPPNGRYVTNNGLHENNNNLFLKEGQFMLLISKLGYRHFCQIKLIVIVIV